MPLNETHTTPLAFNLINLSLTFQTVSSKFQFLHGVHVLHGEFNRWATGYGTDPHKSVLLLVHLDVDYLRTVSYICDLAQLHEAVLAVKLALGSGMRQQCLQAVSSRDLPQSDCFVIRTTCQKSIPVEVNARNIRSMSLKCLQAVSSHLISNLIN